VKSNLRKVLVSRELFLFVLIIAIGLFLYFNNANFLTQANIKSMTLTIAVNSIIASAMTILFISGGFDLSSGSVMAILGIILGIMLNAGMNVVSVIILVLVIGIVIGLINGVLVTKANINPFIVTLGGFFLYRGLAYAIAKIVLGSKPGLGTFLPSFTDFPASFLKIAGGQFLKIEASFYYMIAILIIFGVLITKNLFFRQNYYIGNNENASKLLGMKLDRIKIINYSLVTLMVAVATILRASRIQTTTATTGETLGLEVVAAVIIGGASLKGGEGSILGSFLGIVLLTLIFNAIIVLEKNPVYYEFFVGIVLLASATLNEYMQKANQRKILRKSI